MTAKKKTTTKGKAEGSGSELRKRDADFFARLLAHPEVSPELKNTIHSAITELADETKTHATNPRLLRQLYPLMLEEMPDGYEIGLRNGLYAAIESIEDEGLVEEIRRQARGSDEGTGGRGGEQDAGESFTLTPGQAAALVRQWDTNGDEHSGDLILLCRALAYSDREQAEYILDAVEREIALMSPTVYGALGGLVESRRDSWRKEVPR
ncbi:MAG TPA: hypothetical protein VHU19_03655 [Pyrinomonadaceae bacterium]|jgi:hypothetical protein|nr:hypothetical protein [Pyrinomonadaceae bacterium]